MVNTPFRVGEPVEVHVAFTDSWAAGFEVAELLPEASLLRRVSDGKLLPEPTGFDDVRRLNP